MNITAALTQIENNFPKAAAVIRAHVERLEGNLRFYDGYIDGGMDEAANAAAVFMQCFDLLGLSVENGIGEIPDAIECLKADHAAVTGERE